MTRWISTLPLLGILFGALIGWGIQSAIETKREQRASHTTQLQAGAVVHTPVTSSSTETPSKIKTKGKQDGIFVTNATESIYLLHYTHPPHNFTSHPIAPSDTIHTRISNWAIQHLLPHNYTLGPYIPYHSYIIITTPIHVAGVEEWMISATNISDSISLTLSPFPIMGKLIGTLLIWYQNKTNITEQIHTLTIQLTPRPWTDEDVIQQMTSWQEYVDAFYPGVNIARLETSPTSLPLIRITTPIYPSHQLYSFITYLLPHPSILLMERYQPMRLYNDQAQWITQSGNGEQREREIWKRGIKGRGQIIGSADSGIDWSHCFFYDPKFPNGPTKDVNMDHRKIIAYIPIADKSDDPNGHGTHVIGSILGDPTPILTSKDDDTRTINARMGMAPEAKIYFQDVGVTGSEHLSGLDNDDIGSYLFQSAYDVGVRIHSNSWGSSENEYGTMTSNVDRFVWENKDMLIIFAAGNDGLKKGSTSGTVVSPATSKNIISVGASQTSNTGWINAMDFIDWSAKEKIAAEQLGVDLSTWSCCTDTHLVVRQYCCKEAVIKSIQHQPPKHDFEDMASFSSRGPTFDGRVKPELVAPGQYVISSRSHGVVGDTYGRCQHANEALLSMEGTSMATPVTAGNAAMVRQYLTEGYYPTGSPSPTALHTSPSAALISAILLNGARSLNGWIDLNNDNTNWVSLKDGIYPLNVFQGFGKVELRSILHFNDTSSQEHVYLHDNKQGIHTGQDDDFCVDVMANNTTVKVTLVWHDVPAQPNAAIVQVNNLDLIAGHTSGDSLAGNFVNKRDTRNNVEHIIYKHVRTDQTFHIKIRGWNIPMGPQPYALVIRGSFPLSSIRNGTSCPPYPISHDRFHAAGEREYFPYGPIIGGTVGGITVCALIALCFRFLWGRGRASPAS